MEKEFARTMIEPKESKRCSMEHGTNCHVEEVKKKVDKEELQNASVVWLAITGMGCENCARRVGNGLLSLDGVLRVDVELERHVAKVAFDPHKVNPEDLPVAVAEAGRASSHNYFALLLTEVA
jgi:copper chaperone CopZ